MKNALSTLTPVQSVLRDLDRKEVARELSDALTSLNVRLGLSKVNQLAARVQGFGSLQKAQAASEKRPEAKDATLLYYFVEWTLFNEIMDDSVQEGSLVIEVEASEGQTVKQSARQIEQHALRLVRNNMVENLCVAETDERFERIEFCIDEIREVTRAEYDVLERYIRTLKVNRQ